MFFLIFVIYKLFKIFFIIWEELVRFIFELGLYEEWKGNFKNKIRIEIRYIVF